LYCSEIAGLFLYYICMGELIYFVREAINCCAGIYKIDPLMGIAFGALFTAMGLTPVLLLVGLIKSAAYNEKLSQASTQADINAIYDKFDEETRKGLNSWRGRLLNFILTAVLFAAAWTAQKGCHSPSIIAAALALAGLLPLTACLNPDKAADVMKAFSKHPLKGPGRK